MFGPVGFTLDAGVPEAVMPTRPSYADGLVMFEDLSSEAAAVLLAGLHAEALDERDRPGSDTAHGAARRDRTSRSRAAERSRGGSGP